MPYSKQVLQIPAGINREGTQYSAEGSWYDCDLIRFKQGRAEKIGGWTKYSSNEFLGISRTLMNWSSIDGANLMAVGSNKKLYVELGSVFYDITPTRYKSQGFLTIDMANVSSPSGVPATFTFDVAVGDVVRMLSDANSVGDELMRVMSVAGSGVAGQTITMERGSFGTVSSIHASGNSAFLIENLTSPIYPVVGSSEVLIEYEDHELETGDFVNFLKVGTDTASGGLDRRSLLYNTFDGTNNPATGYDNSRSTQSWQVTKVLTSKYFEVRIANAASGGSGVSTSLAIPADRTDTSVRFPVNTFVANDIVKIGSEYITLTSGPTTVSGNYQYSCNRSQLGSLSSDHLAGALVNEVGIGGSGVGGDTVIIRDQQASASSFTEFSGWGSSTWGGLPGVTVSTSLNADIVDANQNTATVGSTLSFGAAGTLLIGSELVTYVKGSPIGTVFNIVRGQFGTTAEMHSTGTSVFEVDQFWTGWGSPHVPQVFSGTALNLWSVDTFGEDLIASKDKARPYIWNTSLKMRLGSPNKTAFLPNSHTDGFASGICLADAVPLSSIPDDEPGGGDVPEQVGFIMTHPTSRRVISFGSTDTFDEYDPTLVRWSNEGRPGAWDPEPVGSTAGGNPLQRGSRIIGASISNRQILIWTDLALYSMQYIGGNDIFGFQEIADSISIASRFAHKSGRGIVYWMGDNNFYQTNGQSVEKVPCPVLSKIFEELNYDKREVIVSALNSLFNEIIWFYPSGSSEEPDSYALFNYLDNVWAYGSIGRTGWSDSGLREKPNAAYHIDDYNSGPYEGIERSLIYNHEDGYTNDGTKMNSYIESAFFDIEDGDKSMFIDRFAPDFRGLYSTNPELTVDLSARNYPMSPATADSPKVNTLTIKTDTEFLSTRLRGRTMSAKFYDSPSANINGGWELGDSRIRLKQDGER